MRSCAACMSTSTRPVRVLRQDVDAVQLREGEAERLSPSSAALSALRRTARSSHGQRAMAGAPTYRAVSLRAEQRVVERGGCATRQRALRHARLAQPARAACPSLGASCDPRAVGGRAARASGCRAERRRARSAATAPRGRPPSLPAMRPRPRQRALHRVEHELVHRARVAEAHLDLRRMHVDVDQRRVAGRGTAHTTGWRSPCSTSS